MKVLVASRNLAVFDVLHDIEGLDIEEALFSGQVYDRLAEAQLVIIDFPDVVPRPHTVEMIEGILLEKGIPYTTGDEFLADPERWMAEARRIRGEVASLPQKHTIALVSYSGGTGKTTLALDTSLYFARRTGLPVLLLEFTYGESAVAALTGAELPHLFDLATQPDAEATHWKGVTLVPMDYEHCRDLSIHLIGKYLKSQIASHVLTVVDSHWPHALISAIQNEIDRWFVVTTPRVDAVENALKLREELGQRAEIVLNAKGGALDSLALSGIERALDLPRVAQADRFEGQLGKQVLIRTYGPQNWRRYEPQSFVARLGHRLGFGRNRA